MSLMVLLQKYPFLSFSSYKVNKVVTLMLLLTWDRFTLRGLERHEKNRRGEENEKLSSKKKKHDIQRILKMKLMKNSIILKVAACHQRANKQLKQETHELSSGLMWNV